MLDIIFEVMAILFVTGIFFGEGVKRNRGISELKSQIELMGGQSVVVTHEQFNRSALPYFHVRFTDRTGKHHHIRCQRDANGQFVFLTPLGQLNSIVPILKSLSRVQPLPKSVKQSVDKELLYDDLNSPFRSERLAALDELRDMPTISHVLLQRVEEMADSDEDPLVQETAVDILHTY